MKISIPISTLCTCAALVIMFPVWDAIYSIKFWVVFLLLAAATFVAKQEGKKAAEKESQRGD